MADRLFPFFLRFFLPLALLVGMAAYLLGTTKVKAELDGIKNQETLNVDRGAGALTNAIVDVTRDVRFLATQNELKRAIEAPTPDHIQDLASEYTQFSTGKQIYDQVRWLDETGMERVRVDLVGQKAVSLIKAKLQNKGNRYFFTDSIKLAPGEIFISPLDLNIEGNAIELPHKPMLRFATPVSDAHGVKRGIVIVNYLGGELLRAFANATDDIANHAMLVNGDGYWLKSPVPADEWGFMFKKPELSLARRSPAAWSQIRATNQGQVITADGLWTWQSVYPLVDGMTSSTGSAEAFQSSQGEVKSRQYVWKSVAHFPADRLQHLARTLWTQVIGAASAIMGMIAFISFLLARAWHAQAKAEAAAQRTNAALHVELERSNTLNRKLEQAQNRLLQAEKLASIGQLAAGVAHEINNLLIPHSK